MKNKVILLILCSLTLGVLLNCKNVSRFQEIENTPISLNGKIIKLSDGSFGIEGKVAPFGKLFSRPMQRKVRYRLYNDSRHNNEAEHRLKSHNGDIQGIFLIAKRGSSEDWSTVICIVSL